MQLVDNGSVWGGPDGFAALQITCWRPDFIEFLMPSSAVDVSLLKENSIATAIVVNEVGLASAPIQLLIVKVPNIASVNPANAAPGGVVTITGSGFGAWQQPSVRFSNNNYIWLATPASVNGFFVPKPKYPLTLLSWSDEQIQFLVPTDRAANAGGAFIAPGSTATIEVSNQAGISNGGSLALTTSVRWPVSVTSVVANIGGTGEGHMQTSVTIDQSGNLYATTHTWDTDNPLGFFGFLTGFHGSVLVTLLDNRNNPIANAFAQGPYGVEGGQSRTDGWSGTLTQVQRDTLTAVSITHQYDPQWNTAGEVLAWIADHKDQIVAAATVVETIAD